MKNLNLSDLIVEITSNLIIVEYSDKDTLSELLESLNQILEHSEKLNLNNSLKNNIESGINLINELLSDKCKDCENKFSKLLSSLEEVLKELSELMERDSKSSSVKKDSDNKETSKSEDNTKKLILSEYVDEEAFSEFISMQFDVLNEIEADILALDKTDTESLGSLKRKLHTLKGESGVLELMDLEKVCHFIEDYIEDEKDIELLIEKLFITHDWITKSINHYSKKMLPQETADDLINHLNSQVKDSSNSSLESKDQIQEALSEEDLLLIAQATEGLTDNTNLKTDTEESIKQNSNTNKADLDFESDQIEDNSELNNLPDIKSTKIGNNIRSKEDPVSLAVLDAFLEEGNERMTNADQLLFDLEKEGSDPDKVNALFREFHSLKGAAAPLGLTEIATLVHVTETLLDKARDGQLFLKGDNLELLLDSSDFMRRLLESVAIAADSDYIVAPLNGLKELINKLNAVINGESIPKKESKQTKTKATDATSIEHVSEVDALLNNLENCVKAKKDKSHSDKENIKNKTKPNEPDTDSSEEIIKAAKKPTLPKFIKKKDTNVTYEKTIRVDVLKVDALVDLIGELVVLESMISHSPEVISTSSQRLRGYTNRLNKICRDLKDVGMNMRMVPVRGVFQKMRRMIRELSKKSNKAISLEVIGASTEIDRNMVEMISDPLIHMIRNAVDHGIESEEERMKSEKDKAGTIKLSAYHSSGNIVIEISDDGKGLDKERIIEKAIGQNLIHDANGMTDQEIFDLIFAPGFSTAQKITEISGRGVGMDVVKKNVESMRGRISISSKLGQGSTFKMLLPLTLAIIDGMLVACGDERYVIHTMSIVESIQPEKSVLKTFADKWELLNLRGETIPLIRLSEIFEIKGACTDPTTSLVIIIESMGRKIGLMVDEIVAQQQVVIKNMGTELDNIKCVSGAAILSDGKIGLIVNVDEISDLASDRIM